MFVALMIFMAIAYIADDFTSVPRVEEQPVTYNSYIDLDGNMVSLDEFRGSYLWIDYAAEWCSYCEPQTRTIKALDRKIGDRILFITVVTGTNKVMQAPTAETARQWASRFDLEPDRVLARFSTDTLPYHLLYSPEGEILFQGSGLFTTDKIETIIDQHLTY